MAATNRPETLDPALLRPGRFDRQVVIPLPAQRERRAILAVHARGKQLGPGCGAGRGGQGTPGFSGADLANLVNEAAIFAVRAGREVISAYDFSEARDRILLGRRDAPMRCCRMRNGPWPSMSPAMPWSRPSPSMATRWPR